MVSSIEASLVPFQKPVEIAFRNAVEFAHVPFVPVTASEADAKTGKHTLRVVIPGDTMKQTMERCKIIAQGGFTCGIETLPEKLKLASAE